MFLNLHESEIAIRLIGGPASIEIDLESFEAGKSIQTFESTSPVDSVGAETSELVPTEVPIEPRPDSEPVATSTTINFSKLELKQNIKFFFRTPTKSN